MHGPTATQHTVHAPGQRRLRHDKYLAPSPRDTEPSGRHVQDSADSATPVSTDDDQIVLAIGEPGQHPARLPLLDAEPHRQVVRDATESVVPGGVQLLHSGGHPDPMQMWLRQAAIQRVTTRRRPGVHGVENAIPPPRLGHRVAQSVQATRAVADTNEDPGHFAVHENILAPIEEDRGPRLTAS
jgi:hypothetical protein